MAGSSYLNTLLNILPAEQTRQIIEILTDLQNTGGVLTPEEFNQRLQELTSVVNSDGRILPTMELLFAFPLDLCRSSYHNKMLTRAKNDIRSAFLQIDEIGTKIEDHNILFVSNMIKDLKQSVDHQEEMIKRLQWLANRNNEFTYAIVDQFSSFKSIDKSSVEVKKIYDLYFDDRSSAVQSQLYYDHPGKKVILPQRKKDVVRATSIELLSDENAHESENSVDDPQNKLVNIIDGKKGTFWTRNVYSSIKLPKVSTVLKFNFDTAKDVSYIYIESGSSEPLNISSVVGISPEGNLYDLYTTSKEVNGQTRIDFNNTFVKSILVYFDTTTYTKVDYVVPKDVEILDVFESNDVFSNLVKKEKLGKIVHKVIVSDRLSDTVGASEQTTSEKIQKYRYLFSLDNVWFGSESYDSSGIFVSKPLIIENVGSIGVHANEELNSDNNVYDSIEYDVTKIDQLPQYNVSMIPVPKIGQTAVTSERLVFSGQIYDSTVNDLATLRFCPHVPSDWVFGDDEPIKIYKNGELLDAGVDWEFSVSSISTASGNILGFESNFSEITDFTEWNLLPQKMFVVIRNIDPNAVYTANYTIKFSDSNNGSTVWLDSNKTSYIVKDKIIFKKPENLVKSNIYLIIKMRRNISSKFSCPKLFEYSLLGSSYN